MHLLHLAVTIATSPEDACSAVEGFIEDWGDENNWRNIEGCVSQDNECHIIDSSFLDDSLNTVEKITNNVRKWMTDESYYFTNEMELMKKAVAGETLDNNDWWKIEQYASHKSSVAKLKDYQKCTPETFDIFKHTFNEYDYNENGVTRIYCDGPIEGGEKYYIVFINMHI